LAFIGALGQRISDIHFKATINNCIKKTILQIGLLFTIYIIHYMQEQNYL